VRKLKIPFVADVDALDDVTEKMLGGPAGSIWLTNKAVWHSIAQLMNSPSMLPRWMWRSSSLSGSNGTIAARVTPRTTISTECPHASSTECHHASFKRVPTLRTHPEADAIVRLAREGDAVALDAALQFSLRK